MTGSVPGAQRSTREAYRDAVVALLATDERVFCLDSDTGLFAGTDFASAKDRYLNLGISEQNLMGTAAGLAASGKIPFVNTMATFATTRALEAVKIDIAYNRLPVRIAATHGGLAAGHLGPTHHALEDLAAMCVLPGMTVVVPGDAEQAEAATWQTADWPGPVYLRLGKAATPGLAIIVTGAGLTGAAMPPFILGQAQRLRQGTDLAIVACGPHPVTVSVSASDKLATSGVRAAVLNMHTLAPLDVATLLDVAAPVTAVITVEEHWRHGGLGSLVAQTLAEHQPTRVARIGVPHAFAQTTGNQPELLEQAGITDARIIETAHALLGAPAP
jgi:transketolase